jgi:hypothetical protein
MTASTSLLVLRVFIYKGNVAMVTFVTKNILAEAIFNLPNDVIRPDIRISAFNRTFNSEGLDDLLAGEQRYTAGISPRINR